METNLNDDRNDPALTSKKIGAMLSLITNLHVYLNQFITMVGIEITLKIKQNYLTNFLLINFQMQVLMM